MAGKIAAASSAEVLQKKKKPREHRGKQFPNVNKKSFTMTGER